MAAGDTGDSERPREQARKGMGGCPQAGGASLRATRGEWDDAGKTRGLNRGGRDPRLRPVLERSPRFPATRGSRAGRTPGRSATALALAGILAGSGQMTQAKQPPAEAKASPVAEATSASAEMMIVEGGHSAGQTTAENARRDGLTVVDLSDDWLPYVFSEEPGKPQPLRPYLIDLANGRFRSGSQYSRARPYWLPERNRPLARSIR